MFVVHYFGARLSVVALCMQASFKLLVQVSDADTGNPDDFIDILVVERPFSPSLSPSPPTNYTSSARVFSLVMSFRVECSESEWIYTCIYMHTSATDEFI